MMILRTLNPVSKDKVKKLRKYMYAYVYICMYMYTYNSVRVKDMKRKQWRIKSWKNQYSGNWWRNSSQETTVIKNNRRMGREKPRRNYKFTSKSRTVTVWLNVSTSQLHSLPQLPEAGQGLRRTAKFFTRIPPRNEWMILLCRKKM